MGGEFKMNYWLGDVDVGSIKIAFGLESVGDFSPSEEHLVEEIVIVGPYPNEGNNLLDIVTNIDDDLKRKISNTGSMTLKKWEDPDTSMFLNYQGEDRVAILEGFRETGMDLHMEHLPVGPWFDLVHNRIISWKLTKFLRDLKKYLKWRKERDEWRESRELLTKMMLNVQKYFKWRSERCVH
eukprot:scaffold117683_cov46-Cyclotella_meneghiniana.AAC.10